MKKMPETMRKHNETLDAPVSPLSLNTPCSRRQILKWGGVSIVGMSTLGPVLAQGAAKPLIIMEEAQGIIIADPIKCVGCGRCELACVEFNEGKAAPALSRIKVDRNLSFGPEGVAVLREGWGNWGNGLIVPNLCNQCPHPVPCADICPEDAIVVEPSCNARVVDPRKCTGCKLCLKACPWEMLSFDQDTRKATKCHLCNGKPKCVDACPTESLSYRPWRDLTHKVPPRIATTVALASERAIACQECHLPGQQKTVRQGIGMFLGTVKGSRPFSARAFGFKWIDLAGSILLPIALGFVAVHAGLRAVVKKR